MALLPVFAIAQTAEKELTKFEAFTSKTGSITKFYDANMPKLSTYMGGKLEASVDDKIGRDEYEDDMLVVSTAITDLETNIEDLNSQSETIAAALVDLYNKIGDIETLLSQI